MIIKSSIEQIKNKLSKIDNLLLLVNKQTEKFVDILQIKKFICIEISIIEEELLTSLMVCSFLSKEIFLYALQKQYNTNYQNMVQNIIQNHSKENLISPLGVANVHYQIINEENLFSLEKTVIVNNEFLTLHKMVCSLKPIKSILLSILLHNSFLLIDLQEFLILDNLVEEFGFLDIQAHICHSLIDGINILKKNNWKIKEEILMNYKKQDDLYKTFLYGKKIFQEKDISLCSCHFINYKDVDQYTYYNLEKNIPLIQVNRVILQKRHVIIPLKEAQTIQDNKKFYIENILGFKSVMSENNKKKTKPKSLRTQTTYQEFNFMY